MEKKRGHCENERSNATARLCDESMRGPPPVDRRRNLDGDGGKAGSCKASSPDVHSSTVDMSKPARVHGQTSTRVARLALGEFV